MRIAHVTLKNIMGTRELEFDAGKFVELSGPNASGKSTVLEAIKSVVKGGHDATLLMTGAEKGEIVLVLDNGMRLTKTVRPTSSNLVATQDGQARPLPRPAEMLGKIIDRLSNNPVEFLTAKKEDRVSTLLQSMPLQIDLQYLQSISGVRLAQSGMHAYQVIDYVYTQVFDERHDTNKTIDEKEKTIRQLRAAIPELADGVVGGEAEIEEKLAEIDARKDEDLTRVHTTLQQFTDAVNKQSETSTTEHDQALQTYTDQIDAQIDELQKQLDAKRAQRQTGVGKFRADKAATMAALSTRIANVTAKANAKRDEIKGSHLEMRAPFATQLAVLRANRDLAARRAQTLETIATFDAELDHLRADVTRQEKALADIKAYRSKILDDLPIPGLEVRGGEIFRHGITFDRLNKAERVDIAIEVAKLRAGELGVICVDEIENLDSQTFDALRARVDKTDLQFFVTRVTDQPFQISTDSPNF
jgi:energy-coupling factor transporter ATP-binding protein EcfA2